MHGTPPEPMCAHGQHSSAQHSTAQEKSLHPAQCTHWSGLLTPAALNLNASVVNSAGLQRGKQVLCSPDWCAARRRQHAAAAVPLLQVAGVRRKPLLARLPLHRLQFGRRAANAGGWANVVRQNAEATPFNPRTDIHPRTQATMLHTCARTPAPTSSSGSSSDSASMSRVSGLAPAR